MRSTWVSMLGIVLILVLGSAYLAFGVAQIRPGENRFPVTMVLDRTAGVVEGAPVLVRGVPVGEVTTIVVQVDAVHLGLEISEESEIPATSPVRVENLSALGETYVDFRPESGDGPYLTGGEVITRDRVDAPIPIPAVARSVSAVLNEVDPEVLASLTSTLGRSLEGTENVMPELGRTSELLASTLMVRQPELRRLLIDVQAMGADMWWLDPAARESSPLWTLFAQRFSEIADSLARISNVGDTPRMYVEGDGLIPQLERITDWLDREGGSFVEIAPVLQELVADGPQPVDIGVLVGQALDGVSPDGAVRLEVGMR